VLRPRAADALGDPTVVHSTVDAQKAWPKLTGPFELIYSVIYLTLWQLRHLY